MRTSVLLWTLVLACLLSFSISCGGGGDDDDDSADAPTDDDVDDDVDDDTSGDDDVDDDVDDDDDVWSPGATGEAVLADNAKVIEEEQANEAEVEDDALTFPKDGNENLFELEVGDVIGSAGENAFLRKVEDVYEDGDSIIVTTGRATLEDVFEEADFVIELDFAGDRVDPWLNENLGGTNIFNSTIGGVPLRLDISEGYLYFAPVFRFEHVIGTPFLTPTLFDFSVQALLEAGIEVEAQIGGALPLFNKETEINIFKTHLPILVGGWPIDITPSVNIVLGVEGMVNAQSVVTAGAELVSDSQAWFNVFGNVHYFSDDNPEWKFTESHAFDWNPYGPTFDNEVSGYLKVYARLEVEMQLYDVAGPYVQAGPYGKLALQLTPDCHWDLLAGAEGIIGANVEMLGWNIYDYQAEIFDYEVPIDDGDCATTTTTTTSTTTTSTTTTTTHITTTTTTTTPTTTSTVIATTTTTVSTISTTTTTLPILITGVAPLTADLGALTTFTVTGSNMPDTLAAWIDHCVGITFIDRETDQQQFQCTPMYDTGLQDGVIRDHPDGALLHSFEVNVIDDTTTTTTTTPGTTTTAPPSSTTTIISTTSTTSTTDACEGCIIDEICYENGEINPDNVCEICSEAISITSWADNDGVFCDDGVFCNGADACDAGTCSVHVGDPCPDDGQFCNGDEFCNEAQSLCENTGDPCESVIESCQEEDEYCQPTCVGVQVNNGPLDEDNDGDGYSENIGDCNDGNNAVNPGSTEVFDGVDNNCDGVIDDGLDEDCDGYQSEATGGDDCDDNNWQIHPGVADDGLDFIDWNCDGVIGDAASGNADGDGFAALGTSGGVLDCDDNDAAAFPGAAPLDDAMACMSDWDGDDYGDDQAVAPIISGTDCDDADFLSNPGAPELADDGIDQDCDGGDLVRSDAIGVFVATSGDDTNPGTMAAPKRTISAAVALAQATGKSVFVAAENYAEDVETEVSLFGAYESAGWTRDIDAYLTTINASGSTAVKISGSNPVAIQGFTINGGSPTGENSYGVYNYATATLVDNTINGGSGYGVYNNYGTATLVNNTINGGSGDNSSGVRNSSGTATLVNNTINGGSGNSYNYGVHNNYGTATLVNNTINGGSGSIRNCGVANWGTATLVNNTINGGSGSTSYGVYNNSGMATLVNNTINGGSGRIRSYGVGNWATATLVNNDFWGLYMDCMIYGNGWQENTIAEVNACAWFGCDEASSNISADPLFVDPTGGDYHLQSGSPCVDAGIDPVPDWGLVNFDFDGDARPYGAGWDIGADEWMP